MKTLKISFSSEMHEKKRMRIVFRRWKSLQTPAARNEIPSLSDRGAWHGARMPAPKISKSWRKSSAWLDATINGNPLTIWLNAENKKQLTSSCAYGPTQYPSFCQCPRSCPRPYP